MLNGLPSEISSCRSLVSLEAIPARVKRPLAPKQGVVEEMLTRFGNVHDDRPTPCQPWPSRRCHVSCDIGGVELGGGHGGDPDSSKKEIPTRISGFLAIPKAASQEPINRASHGRSYNNLPPGAGPPCVRACVCLLPRPLSCSGLHSILRCYRRVGLAVSCS